MIIEQSKLKEYCEISNSNTDNFVGIKINHEGLLISFPIGYSLSKSNKGIREDVKQLIRTLEKYKKNIDGDLHRQSGLFDEISEFPISSYMYIIEDYLNRGYYYDYELKYEKSNSGKINWPRTIKCVSPTVAKNSIVYLDFVRRNTNLLNDSIITRIHQYCVFESFSKIGWLYTDYKPIKVEIQPGDLKFFISVLKERYSSTFNDQEKLLFVNMLAILKSVVSTDGKSSFMYGTYKFEYIWESLVDFVFGVKDKNKYFPSSSWHVFGENKLIKNRPLEPDTIIKWNNDIFILDAKYYRFGVSGIYSHLPETSSIHKQITYAEFIDKNPRFTNVSNIYNAFIIPYNSSNESWFEIFGYAESDWKGNELSYEKIIGVLVDTKSLMSVSLGNNIQMKEDLIHSMRNILMLS